MQVKKTYLMAVLYAFIIGLSPFFLKLAIQYNDAISVVAHRFLIASLFYFFINKEKIKLKECLMLLPISLLFPLGTFIFQTKALETASTIQVGIIQANVPIIAMIGAYLMWKEKLTKKQLVFTVLSTVGVIYIFTQKTTNNLTIGILFSILAALSWGVYSVIVKKYLNTLSVQKIGKIIILNAAIVFNVYAFFKNSSYLNGLVNLNYLLYIAYLAIFATVISMTLSIYVTHQIGVTKASVFNNLATVITIIIGALILNEQFSIHHLIGSTIVIFSTYQVNRGIKNVSESE